MVFPMPGSQRPRDAVGAWRGVVTRVTGGLAYVEIPRLARGHEYGPVEHVQGVFSPALSTETAGDPAHAHGLGVDLAAGDRVLVLFVEASRDSPVIVGRLA